MNSCICCVHSSRVDTCTIAQVAFGSDFSQPWSDKALGLKFIKGDGSLGFLIDHAFKGVEINSRQPFFHVSGL